jgi:hypothetical protein
MRLLEAVPPRPSVRRRGIGASHRAEEIRHLLVARRKLGLPGGPDFSRSRSRVTGPGTPCFALPGGGQERSELARAPRSEVISCRAARGSRARESFSRCLRVSRRPWRWTSFCLVASSPGGGRFFFFYFSRAAVDASALESAPAPPAGATPKDTRRGREPSDTSLTARFLSMEAQPLLGIGSPCDGGARVAPCRPPDDTRGRRLIVHWTTQAPSRRSRRHCSGREVPPSARESNLQRGA